MQHSTRTWEWSPAKRFVGRVLCRLGFHNFSCTPIIASLGTYWLQGGKECFRCCVQKIDADEARRLLEYAYGRGKAEARNEMLAYGRGVDDIAALYGKSYVQQRLDKL